MNAAVVLLALVWAAVLLPGLLRDRRGSLHATVGGFERAMDVLRSGSQQGHGSGRQLLVPGDANRIVRRPADSGARGDEPAVRRGAPARRSDPLLARRRAAFTRLLGALGVTLVAAVLLGGVLWPALLVLLAVTGGYAALLRHHKVERDQARAVVRDLRPERTRPAVGAEHWPQEQAVGAAVGWQHPGGADEPWSPEAAVRIRRWED